MENIKYSREFIADINGDNLDSRIVGLLDGMECMSSNCDPYMGTTTVIKRYSIEAIKNLANDDAVSNDTRDLLVLLLNHNVLDNRLLPFGIYTLNDCDYMHILYDV